MHRLEAGSGRTRVWLTWRVWGSDLHVHIGGGSQHIGAVALVGRQPDGERYEGVLHVPPHREDQITLQAAQALHAATGVNICVTAGIHLDGITPGEIKAVRQNVRDGTADLAATLRTREEGGLA